MNSFLEWLMRAYKPETFPEAQFKQNYSYTDTFDPRRTPVMNDLQLKRQMIDPRGRWNQPLGLDEQVSNKILDMMPRDLMMQYLGGQMDNEINAQQMGNALRNNEQGLREYLNPQLGNTGYGWNRLPVGKSLGRFM